MSSSNTLGFATLVSPAGSVTSGSDSHLDCHSIPSVSLRYSASQIMKSEKQEYGFDLCRALFADEDDHGSKKITFCDFVTYKRKKLWYNKHVKKTSRSGSAAERNMI